MNKNNILIFITAFNHAEFIESVIDKIDIEAILKEGGGEYQILVSDDNSSDRTLEVVENYKKNNPNKKINLVTHKTNLGYGGNQKYGYNYAISNNFDVIVILHDDGQYPSQSVLNIISPIINDNYGVVLGSRMINKKDAIKGGMPIYKFIGNIVLTKIQNILLKTKLSEFHTGFRAYRVKALKSIPFNCNSNGFAFDTDILIQVIDRKIAIKEIPIPARYKGEYCNVNVFNYGLSILFFTAIYRLQKIGIVNLKKFRLQD